MQDSPVYLQQMGMVCALGDRADDVFAKLLASQSHGCTFTDSFSPGRSLPLGVVKAPLPDLELLPLRYRSRCNQLLLAAFEQIRVPFETARQSIDPRRIAVLLGTSTSGIAEGQMAIASLPEYSRSENSAAGNKTAYPESSPQCGYPEGFDFAQQQLGSAAEYLAEVLDIEGPAYVISTACSSSAKALASARRLLRLGICDLVIAGGVDALCGLTVHGFSSLELVSDAPCQPFSASRNGINIGEGAALFLLSRERGPVMLCGVGEGSDAYHFSAPQPQGLGAVRVMQAALDDAGLSAADVGYVNLHGTATPQNDMMESLAVEQVLGNEVACSSTKAYTGHTLGAAGAIEAAICWLSLINREQGLPVQCWDGQRDAGLAPLKFVQRGDRHADLRYAMSNSFAFGGNNISLILGRVE